MISGIGEKTIELMKNDAANYIDAEKRKIQTAFLQSEDSKIKVSLTFDIAETEGKLVMDSRITYTVEKVKLKKRSYIEENQPGLFAIEPPKAAAN